MDKNYGSKIKEARKKLGLIQADLASINLSRTNISDIEKGKAKLVPSKGLLIYEVLVVKSVEKKIRISLEFDDLLSTNTKYVQLKKAYDLILDLRLQDGDTAIINPFEIEKYRIFAIRSNIGLLKYFLLMELSNLEKTDIQNRIKLLTNTLDYLRWERFSDIQEKYDVVLNALTIDAYKERKLDELIMYYEFQKDNLLELGKAVSPRVYYNLYLFYEESCHYKEALFNIEIYLSQRSILSIEDYYSALIAKARLFTKQKMYKKGIELYEDLLSELNDTRMVSKKSIILSNLIYNIPKLDTAYSMETYKGYMDTLRALVSDVINQKVMPAHMYANLSIGYNYIGDYEASREYCVSAIELAENNSQKVEILFDLFDNIKNVKLDNLFIRTLVSINEAVLNEKIRRDLFVLLLRVQKQLLLDDNKELVNILENYINDLGGKNEET